MPKRYSVILKKKPVPRPRVPRVRPTPHPDEPPSPSSSSPVLASPPAPPPLGFALETTPDLGTPSDWLAGDCSAQRPLPPGAEVYTEPPNALKSQLVSFDTIDCVIQHLLNSLPITLKNIAEALQAPADVFKMERQEHTALRSIIQKIIFISEHLFSYRRKCFKQISDWQPSETCNILRFNLRIPPLTSVHEEKKNYTQLMDDFRLVRSEIEDTLESLQLPVSTYGLAAEQYMEEVYQASAHSEREYITSFQRQEQNAIQFHLAIDDVLKRSSEHEGHFLHPALSFAPRAVVHASLRGLSSAFTDLSEQGPADFSELKMMFKSHAAELLRIASFLTSMPEDGDFLSEAERDRVERYQTIITEFLTAHVKEQFKIFFVKIEHQLQYSIDHLADQLDTILYTNPDVLFAKSIVDQQEAYLPRKLAKLNALVQKSKTFRASGSMIFDRLSGVELLHRESRSKVECGNWSSLVRLFLQEIKTEGPTVTLSSLMQREDNEFEQFLDWSQFLWPTELVNFFATLEPIIPQIDTLFHEILGTITAIIASNQTQQQKERKQAGRIALCEQEAFLQRVISTTEKAQREFTDYRLRFEEVCFSSPGDRVRRQKDFVLCQPDTIEVKNILVVDKQNYTDIQLLFLCLEFLNFVQDINATAIELIQLDFDESDEELLRAKFLPILEKEALLTDGCIQQIILVVGGVHMLGVCIRNYRGRLLLHMTDSSISHLISRRFLVNLREVLAAHKTHATLQITQVKQHGSNCAFITLEALSYLSRFHTTETEFFSEGEDGLKQYLDLALGGQQRSDLHRANTASDATGFARLPQMADSMAAIRQFMLIAHFGLRRRWADFALKALSDPLFLSTPRGRDFTETIERLVITSRLRRATEEFQRSLQLLKLIPTAYDVRAREAALAQPPSPLVPESPGPLPPQAASASRRLALPGSLRSRLPTLPSSRFLRRRDPAASSSTPSSSAAPYSPVVGRPPSFGCQACGMPCRQSRCRCPCHTLAT